MIAPDWPYDDRSPAELRAAPTRSWPRSASARSSPFRAHHPRVAGSADPDRPFAGRRHHPTSARPRPRRGRRRIDPAPTPGVPLGPHAIVSALPVVSRPPQLAQGESHVAQVLPQPLRADGAQGPGRCPYDRYIVPTAGRVYWNGVINAIRINWSNPERAPLLLIGGELDLIADASMTGRSTRSRPGRLRAPSSGSFPTGRTGPAWTKAGRRSPTSRSTGL